MMRFLRTAALLLGACASAHRASAGPATVREGGRRLPLVHDVDVVVVGGTTGAVSAAVEAAANGATVFLAAPRAYLGEDMCATYRLWLEPGEVPAPGFESRLFEDPLAERSETFTYAASLPSVDRHVDSDPPTMLCDGQWGSGYTQSVQYNGDVTITADLGEIKPLSALKIRYFQADRNFEVLSVAIATSTKGESWVEQGSVRNDKLGQGTYVESALMSELELRGPARYVRIDVQKGEAARRILLGEIQIFAEEPEEHALDAVTMVRPMHIKRCLDQALLDADIPFVYESVVSDVLLDRAGEPAGVVVANRAGRQAVRAKVIIDATDRAWTARLAGAQFADYPDEPARFERIVVGGNAHEKLGVSVERIPMRLPLGGKTPIRFGNGGFGDTTQRLNSAMNQSFDQLLNYTLMIPLPDGSYASRARAEQIARDLTFDPCQLDASDVLFQVPPDPLVALATQNGPWNGAEHADLRVLQPNTVKWVFVLGGCAAVSRQAAESLLRPLQLIRLGQRVGRAAAVTAAERGPVDEVSIRHSAISEPPGRSAEVHEELRGLRPFATPPHAVEQPPRALPVLGEYDVVVVGGGTSGAPAAIGAARHGADTLVIEKLTALGGTGTTGLIGLYCAGYRKGFTAEVDAGIAQLQTASYVVGKAEWWRSQIRAAGGTIWFSAVGCGAYVEDRKVRGVVVVTPQGRGVVLAGTVVDATGNGDIAVAAGAQVMYVGPEHVGMQGTGLPPREIGASYVNTDWTYVDETDMIDVQTVFVAAKNLYPAAYDLAQLIDTRERRRIRGDIVLTPLDIVNRRTFPDTVGMSQGGRLDSHGFTVHPFYMINNWLGGITYTPYRCLLPRGLDGILVVGLAVSAHRDAIPSIRMQPCMQNLGYAAGVAAAMAARSHGATRKVDVRALQQHLHEKGCITREVLAHTDSFPLPDSDVEEAVRQLVNDDYSALGGIMAATDRALPLIGKAYSNARHEGNDDGALRCAHVLGMLGDSTGIDVLIEVVDAAEAFDTERIARYFPCITWLDSYIIALGRTRDPRAVPPLMRKLALLRTHPNPQTSHVRAVCEAFEQLGSREAAAPLAALLQACGGDQQAATDIRQVADRSLNRGRGGTRNLILARVLYRCGDWQNIGEKVLRAYADDVRGVYARHARAVLEKPPGEPTRPDNWLGF